MAKKSASFKTMSVDALLSARDTIDKLLTDRLSSLTNQLRRLDGMFGSEKKKREPKPGTKRRKAVAAKYRGPDGQTWAGRGMKPRWLIAALAEGRSIDDFAIANGGASKPKKARKFAGKRQKKAA